MKHSFLYFLPFYHNHLFWLPQLLSIVSNINTNFCPLKNLLDQPIKQNASNRCITWVTKTNRQKQSSSFLSELALTHAFFFILEPPLSKGARVVVKSYGNWTNFCQSYGYKPWEDEDKEDARQLAESFAKEVNEENRPRSRWTMKRPVAMSSLLQMYEWQSSTSSLSSNSQPLIVERVIFDASLCSWSIRLLSLDLITLFLPCGTTSIAEFYLSRV